MQTILLATDLDNTLVGDASALKQLDNEIERLRMDQRMKLAYVTGRSLEAYSSLAKEQSLLKPDAIITDVGTEIYEGEDLRTIAWPAVSDWDKDLIKNALLSIPEMKEQPTSEQGKYRISYYLESQKAYEQIVNLLRHLPVDVIYSGEKYLDILPRGINKGSALSYLAQTWGIDKTDIIACGDSANDIAMLRENKAIIVGNAKRELLDWVKSTTDTDYYLASENYSSGILEGLRYFGVV